MHISIEPLSQEHLPQLETLARETFTRTFGHLYSAENLASHLNKTCTVPFFQKALLAGKRILVAREGRELVGYVKYGDLGLAVEHEEGDAEIHRLYVADSHHRRGIGKLLIEAALADGRLRQAANIFLGVWENNVKAQAFYSRYGFEAVGEYTYYVGTHADREFIMRRRNAGC